MEEILKVEQISQTYQADNGELTALEDISFSVGKGEFVSIVGPSGCGKSTLLTIMAGIIGRRRRRCCWRENPSPALGHIGYMLQKDNLLEWRTIYKNIVLGLEIRKKLTPENIEYAKGLLKTYGFGISGTNILPSFPAACGNGLH